MLIRHCDFNIKRPGKYTLSAILVICLTAVIFLLSACEQSSHIIVPHGLPVSNIMVIRPPHDTNALAEKDGILWAGGWDGVSRIDMGNATYLGELDEEIRLRYVKSLCVDSKGILWIAHDKGLASYDGVELKNMTVKEGLPDDRVNWVTQDSKGRLLVGTWGGAAIIDINGRSVTNVITSADGLINNMVNNILETTDGSLWFGSYTIPSGGISILKDGEWSYFNYDNGLPNNNITAIKQFGDGSVWVAAGFYNKGGVAIFRLTKDKWETEGIMLKEDGLAGEKARSLFQAEDGSIWIGSEYDGLAVKDNSGISIIRASHGLSDNEIKTMLQDDKGNIWIGTRDGISKIEF